MRFLLLAAALAPLCAFAACTSFTASDDSPLADAGDAATTNPPDAASTDYAAVVLEDHPVAYWRMNEPSGITLDDATGHGNQLVLTGAEPARVAGITAEPDDRGVSFGSTAVAGSMADAFGVLAQDFTVECWIKAGAPPAAGQYQTIWSRYVNLADPNTTAPQPRDGVLFYLTDKEMVLERDQGASASFVHTLELPGSGDYHHLVVERNLGALQVYLDGSALGSSVVSGFALDPVTTTFSLGRDVTNNAAPFTGTLDEVAVYDHPLPIARIMAHRSARPAAR